MKTGGRISRMAGPAMLVGSIIALAGTTAPAMRGGLAANSSSTPAPAASRPASFDRAYILPIVDVITDVTHESLERRLKTIGDASPELVIFELDTPGGSLGATLEICSTIKRLRDGGIRTYAWVNDQAYSAGTIIALATDGILMATNATIGDCQPIQITYGGPAAVPEEIEAKTTSPLLAELRDSVRRNRYNLDMVLALIRPEMEIFWVENVKTGERRFVDTRGRDELFGITRTEERDAGERAGGLLSWFTREEPETGQPGPDEPVSDEDSTTDWRYVKSSPDLAGEISQPIVDHRTLLTMRTDEATAYGFCLATLSSESELSAYFNVTRPLERLENTWLESAIEWLASPAVRAVLFLLMLLGAYTEFQTPGFGVPGAVALVALVLFLGAPYLAGYTVTWEIAAIVLGIALLAIEAFVIPGFGVAGITGIVLLAVGLLASFAPAEPTFDEDWFRLPTLGATYTYLKHGLYSLAVGMVGSIFGMALIAKYFPRVPVAGRIIAPNPTHESVQMDDPYHGAAQVGDIGRVEGILRPSGKARFGATLVDVVTEGDYIPGGVRVEVIQRRGNRVVVRRVD